MKNRRSLRHWSIPTDTMQRCIDECLRLLPDFQELDVVKDIRVILENLHRKSEVPFVANMKTLRGFLEKFHLQLSSDAGRLHGYRLLLEDKLLIGRTAKSITFPMIENLIADSVKPEKDHIEPSPVKKAAAISGVLIAILGKIIEERIIFKSSEIVK